ncbi:LysR family transcriptional regulator [Affinirhizobium pseudoryzae]|jgi:DNA-binding transcriptional LysR family regulator|uniref:LysR family transcriptional regulator n=1 Tax=Allorhizobium pseudoryzae TaxID=379684 RepID=UPI0013E9C4E4|nr:LysR family transcriptional regulator [Allorhizobium pseudoryzae]
MNWDDLRHLASFAEEGSLLGAARRLSVEHATVARRIESLEAALNLKLVDRRGRRLSLTAEGERIAAIARRMSGEADGIPRIVDTSLSSVHGEVTISVPPAFGAAVVAPHVARLTAEHPQLTIRLMGEARQASLNRREADIAIRLSRPVEGDLMIVKLMEISFRAYASPDYLANHPRDRWQFIGSDGETGRSPQQAELQRLAGDQRFSAWTGEVLMQLALAKNGGGIAMLPDFLKPEDNRLVPAFPEHPPLMREAWLVVHNDLRRSPAVRAVIDHLKKTLQPRPQGTPPT